MHSKFVLHIQKTRAINKADPQLTSKNKNRSTPWGLTRDAIAFSYRQFRPMLDTTAEHPSFFNNFLRCVLNSVR